VRRIIDPDRELRTHDYLVFSLSQLYMVGRSEFAHKNRSPIRARLGRRRRGQASARSSVLCSSMRSTRSST
jgi:hypothetical protein